MKYNNLTRSTIMTPILSLKLDEIREKHKSFAERTRDSIRTGIEIGRLLVECRQDIPDGQWMAWYSEHVPFGYTMISFYINLWEKRDLVLGEIEKMLEPPTWVWLKKIVGGGKRKKRTAPRERCPHCGQILSNWSKKWMANGRPRSSYFSQPTLES